MALLQTAAILPTKPATLPRVGLFPFRRPTTPPCRESPTQANVARPGGSSVELAVDPRHQEIHNAGLAFWRDVCSFRNLPPVGEAIAAATGAGMLRFEHGMTAHRCLFSVIGRICRGEACADEVLAMAANRLHALVRDVLPIRIRKAETVAELGLCKFLERGIRSGHGVFPFSRLRRSRQSGSLASISALNLGPCPCAFRCVSSCTTTYSISSRLFPASIRV